MKEREGKRNKRERQTDRQTEREKRATDSQR